MKIKAYFKGYRVIPISANSYLTEDDFVYYKVFFGIIFKNSAKTLFIYHCPWDEFYRRFADYFRG